MHIAEILISEISWKPVNFPSFESQPFRCPHSGNLHDHFLNKRYLDNFPSLNKSKFFRGKVLTSYSHLTRLCKETVLSNFDFFFRETI